MSKGVNEIEKRLIDSLNKTLSPERLIKATGRYIYLTEDEFNQVSSSKCVNPLSINGKRFISFFMNDHSYIGVLGIEDCKNTNSDIGSANLTASLFMSLSGGILPQVIKTPSEIHEVLYNEEDDTPDFNGYKIDEILPIYEPITVYEIPYNYDDYDWTIKIIVGLICDNKEILALHFSEGTIESYRTLCLQQTSCIDNMISSMSSYNWRYAFLDAYRCIEPLFDKPIVYEMFDIWKIDKGQFSALHKFIKDRFHWSKNEVDAMDSLFNNLPEPYKNKYDGLDLGNDGIGNNIYKLRNQIVHFQNHQNEMETKYSPHDWDKLIGALLDSLSYFYNHYQN